MHLLKNLQSNPKKSKATNTKDELNALIQKERAKKSYPAYVEYVHEGRWKPTRHLLFLCEQVEKFLADQLVNENGIPYYGLIIEMPPQHGKSMTTTETLPSYYLGKNPSHRIIEVSYGDDFAMLFGRRNLQKLEQFGEDLFGIKLSKKSVSDIEIERHNGGMISRGIGGQITGRPADLIIIDDPFKNRQEADSETIRNNVWDEWFNTIKTRLSATGKVILINTRWHEDDLAGRLTKAEIGRWHTITLRCEAEEDDPLGRNIGDALAPELGKDNEWLKQQKSDYTNDPQSGGVRAWNALFQQRPNSEEGEMFKRYWWKFYHRKGQNLPPVSFKKGDETVYIQSIELPDTFDEQLQSWDCTFKDSAGSDYVVGQVWGRFKANKFLIDQVKKRMDITATMDAIRAMTKKHKKALLKLIEDKANGTPIISMLKKEISGIVPIVPKSSKISRASAVAPEIESGNVYLPHPANEPWVHDFINEFSSFPKAKHDDQVDATSQALNRLMYRFVFEEEKELEGFYTPSELEDLGFKTNKIIKVK